MALPPFKQGSYTPAPVLSVSTVLAGPTGPGALVLDRMLEILANELPQVLVNKSLPAIQLFDYAGVDLMKEDKNFPAVLAALETTSEPFGIGKVMEYIHPVIVYCPVHYAPNTLAHRQSRHIADLVLNVMFPYIGSSEKPVGGTATGQVSAWRSLEPVGVRMIPSKPSLYTGWMAVFKVFVPSVNATSLWARV